MPSSCVLRLIFLYTSSLYLPRLLSVPFKLHIRVVLNDCYTIQQQNEHLFNWTAPVDDRLQKYEQQAKGTLCDID